MTDNYSSLTERELKILKLIAENYILTGDPVGSRWLSKTEGVGLSPATLRNIMTDLTEKELLEQPYTSSGRVPTDKGYRVYVNLLASSQEESAPLEGVEPLSKFLPKQAEKLESLFHSTAKYLSAATKFISLLTTPSPLESSLKKIDFITLSPHHILVLMITQSGMVLHKNITTRETIDEGVLSATCAYFNRKFSGRLLRDIRESLLDNLTELSEGREEQTAAIVRLCKKAFSLNEHGHLISHGLDNFYCMGTDLERTHMMGTLRMIDNQEALVEVMHRSAQGGVVAVVIGNESCLDEFSQCSMVTANYGNGARSLGTLGVIGPKRMHYDRVKLIIQSAAEELSHEIQYIMNT